MHQLYHALHTHSRLISWSRLNSLTLKISSYKKKGAISKKSLKNILFIDNNMKRVFYSLRESSEVLSVKKIFFKSYHVHKK